LTSERKQNKCKADSYCHNKAVQQSWMQIAHGTNSIAHGIAVGYGICSVRDLLTERMSTFLQTNLSIEHSPAGAVTISMFSYGRMATAPPLLRPQEQFYLQPNLPKQSIFTADASLPPATIYASRGETDAILLRKPNNYSEWEQSNPHYSRSD
jgi:hypothetical protein